MQTGTGSSVNPGWVSGLFHLFCDWRTLAERMPLVWRKGRCNHGAVHHSPLPSTAAGNGVWCQAMLLGSRRQAVPAWLLHLPRAFSRGKSLLVGERVACAFRRQRGCYPTSTHSRPRSAKSWYFLQAENFSRAFKAQIYIYISVYPLVRTNRDTSRHQRLHKEQRG